MQHVLLLESCPIRPPFTKTKCTKYGLSSDLLYCSNYIFHRDPTVKKHEDFHFTVRAGSSHADDPATMRSTYGWCILLHPGQGCISAKSTLRPHLTCSSTESEYCTYSDCSREGFYVKQFLDELGLFGNITFDVATDSQPAINALKKGVTQSRFKHVRIVYHFLRELLASSVCTTIKVPTTAQVITDLATKPLSSPLVKKFSKIALGG